MDKVGFLRTEDGIWHSKVDCWQFGAGFDAFYDYVFNQATNMYKDVTGFSYDGEDYRFWFWKGDYLNFGAGAELGIYRRAFGSPHWICEPGFDLHMSMCLSNVAGEVVAEYYPEEPQWWVTCFNSFYQGAYPQDLSVVYTVDFSAKPEDSERTKKRKAGLFEAFCDRLADDSDESDEGGELSGKSKGRWEVGYKTANLYF
jgi:hypothetical protein